MAADIRPLIALVAIGVAGYHRWAHGTWLVWPIVAAAILLVWFSAVPRTMRPISRALLRVAGAVGRVNNVIVLGVLFFVVITPIGILMRRGQRKRLGLQLTPDAESYWTQRAGRGRDVDFTKTY